MSQKKKLNKGKRPPRTKGNQKPYQRPRPKTNTIHDEKLEKFKQEQLATALEKQKAGKRLNIFEARLILEQGK